MHLPCVSIMLLTQSMHPIYLNRLLLHLTLTLFSLWVSQQTRLQWCSSSMRCFWSYSSAQECWCLSHVLSEQRGCVGQDIKYHLASCLTPFLTLKMSYWMTFRNGALPSLKWGKVSCKQGEFEQRTLFSLKLYFEKIPRAVQVAVSLRCNYINDCIIYIQIVSSSGMFE